MQKLLPEFGYKRGKDFWKTNNRLYKKNTDYIGTIRTSSGKLARKESEIADEFRKVFEGKHLSTQKFDEDHHEYVKRENSVDSNYNEHNDDLFEDEITMVEKMLNKNTLVHCFCCNFCRRKC